MKMWALGVIMLMVMALMAGMVSAMSTSFSPQEVWSQGMNPSEGIIKSVTSSMDANNDGYADMIVEMANYSKNTLTLALLDGVNGATLNETTFTDAGYSATGDMVGMDATMWGIIQEDSTGTPVMEQNYVIFGNHSNNMRVSVYALNYPSLQNVTYRGIDIPSSIKISIFTITVSYYNWIFHPVLVNDEPYLVYFGIYSGTLAGQTAYELQIIVLNKTLDTVWERTEKMGSAAGMAPFGVDMVGLNGVGFHNDHEDILFANLTSSPGNVSLYALNLTNGNVMWNLNVSGSTVIFDPIAMLTSVKGMGSYLYDYNRDNRTDIMFATFNSTWLRYNFIDATGTLLGYYETTNKNASLFAMATDVKMGRFHRIVQSVDVNGDGNGEVFFVENNTRLICWDIAHNNSLWTMSLVNQSYHYMPLLSTSDINGDGVWEIYVEGINDTNDNGVDVKNANVTAVNPTDGAVLWRSYTTHLVGGFLGTGIIKEISDVNNDGVQDSITIEGYHNDGTSLYVNISAFSMKDGSTIWTSKISAANSTDFKNWSTSTAMVGDIDGDGYSDVIVKLYYHNNTMSDTYIRILSGNDGSLIWSGEVLNDTVDTDVFAYVVYPTVISWNQFDYNHDGKTNEILITTSSNVYVYAVTQPVPEFNSLFFLAIFVPAVVLLIRRRH